MDTDTQAVVIGAGPCGLATAGQLLRRGVRVRIFEALPEPARGSRAIMLWPPAQAVLDDLEMLDAARGQAHTPGRLDYHGDTGRLVSVGLRARQAPLVLPQSRTDALLESAVRRSGGTVERDRRLVSLTQRDDTVEVVVRDGAGRHEQLCTRWLIGADGVHSTVRELLGVAFTGSALPTPFILAEGPLSGVRVPDVPAYYLTSRGGMVIAPLPKGRYRVAGSAVDGQEATAGFIQDILDTRGPGGLRMDDIETLTTFSSSERIAARMRSGRVLLVGDAAHTHSAVGGQGLNLGLQDVRNLAWKLAGVLGGTLDEAVLDTYEPERLAAARQIVKATGDVTRVALARPPWSGLRNAVLRIAERTPPAQSRYAATVAGQRIRYPTSALGRPAGFRRTGLPAPGWAAAATTAGDRFTLLTCGPSDGPLSIAAEALTRRYPALLSHHQLRRRRREFLLIRPDGYVAVRGRPKDLPRTERLLTAIGSDPQPTERSAMPHRHDDHQTYEAHAATFRKWADSIMDGDVEAYASCWAPDAVAEDIAMGMETRGVRDISAAAARWFEAIVDQKIILLAQLEGDGYSAVMWELSAQAQGTFTELSTDVRPGSRFTKQGMSAFRFNDQAQFVWERSHWDRASVLRQIEAPHDD
ncbi:FAD-dependent monooxygenase [Streptomyces qinglanensis]|uniref:2-polyprenyl-6-methoxyphenol hydroxylase n=1 Tax=Streptomyces qinglanensis TaxID=943816 RepID=A0A1H9QQ07_9ACTN|nr:FAD-dependent monooxygenase [Streptomyces qinglanensis]SER62586.1 2-polyprenyl-6-methoxyphenol hydroxylase [Streptomyces qinglanensis]